MAIITLCVAFTDKLFTTASASGNACWLITSLCIFAASILFGIFNLMGLTGQLGKHEPKTSDIEAATPDGNAAAEVRPEPNSTAANQEVEVSIYSSTNRWTSIIQVTFFLFGLVFALTYIGRSTLSKPVEKNNDTVVADACKCIEKTDSSATYNVTDTGSSRTVNIQATDGFQHTRTTGQNDE